jgi:hypothetical protein
VPAGSPFFCIDLLEHRDVQIALGQQLLQLRVLGFECLQTLDIAGGEFTEMLASGVNRLFAELVLLGSFGHRRAVGLAQDRHHLFLAESTLPHGLLGIEEPSSQESLDRRKRAGQQENVRPAVSVVHARLDDRLDALLQPTRPS